jgi:hypothetical protein
MSLQAPALLPSAVLSDTSLDLCLTGPFQFRVTFAGPVLLATSNIR